MATVKNKEECSKILKKFAPPVKKAEDDLSVQALNLASVNEEYSAARRDALSPAKTVGVDSVASKNRHSTSVGVKDNKKKTGKSDSDKKMKRKRREAVNNAAKILAIEDKENMLEINPCECSQEIKTLKEQCHLTDSQYEELFQSVLQKSIKDCLEDFGKIIDPFQKVEEQDACHETCMLTQAGGNSLLTVPSVEPSSAKKRSSKPTRKQPVAECQNSHKLSLKKQSQKKAGAVENKKGRKRTRKGQPKKIVEGYTQITDQEDIEEEEEEEPLNQCIAWVQCNKSNCEKWRRLESGIDPSSLPDSWSCSQNTDSKFNNCDMPEESWSGSDDEVIYATFVPGSIVWAKQRGYSWWPGMVEADPDIGVYFLFTSNLDQLPSKYHVTFFGESVSRAWISASMLKNFQELTAESLDLKKGKNKDCSKRFGVGLKMAEEAEKINIQERIAKFGFSGRYRHQDESQQPGFREEDFDVCGNDKQHLTSRHKKCELESHVPTESVDTAHTEVEILQEKENTLQSKPAMKSVTNLDENDPAPRKVVLKMISKSSV